MSRRKVLLITAICLFPLYLLTNSLVIYFANGTRYDIAFWVSVCTSISYFLAMSGIDCITQRK